jgi:hypothetical protein
METTENWNRQITDLVTLTPATLTMITPSPIDPGAPHCIENRLIGLDAVVLDSRGSAASNNTTPAGPASALRREGADKMTVDD